MPSKIFKSAPGATRRVRRSGLIALAAAKFVDVGERLRVNQSFKPQADERPVFVGYIIYEERHGWLVWL